MFVPTLHPRNVLSGLVLLGFLLFAPQAFAQDFEIDRYDVAVTLKPSANAADVRATLKLTNRTTQGKSASLLTLKISTDAKVASVTLDGTEAQFKQDEDNRLKGLATLSAALATPVAPNGALTVRVAYTLTVKESNAYAAITPGDSVLLPESFWVPVVHTPLQPHGADTAPVTLAVTLSEGGGEVLSDGERTVGGTTTTFATTLAGQPWLAVGAFGKPATRTVGGTTVEVYSQPGIAGTDAQAKRLLDELEQAIAFQAKIFGAFPAGVYRVFSTARGTAYISPMALVVGQPVFRRDGLDAETIELIARGTTRTTLGGKVRLRGKGLGIVQDALPSYVTGVYFETRFGADAARAYWSRRTRAHAPVGAQSLNAPLLVQTPFDATYYPSMLNKGALVFRLLERQIGKPALLDAVKKLAASDETSVDQLRSLVAGADRPEAQRLLKQWWDDLVEPDFIVGIPQANPAGGWTCAVRNLGTGDAVVPLAATTDKGDTLTATVRLAGQTIGRAEFKTDAQVVSVEVDPEKLFPQSKIEGDSNSKQYDNDARPPRLYPFSAFLQATQLFEQKKYDEAEAKLNEALAVSPDYAACRVLLARTHIAKGKLDAAQAELAAALKQTPPSLYVMGWAAVAQGDIAAAKKDMKAALAAYRRAAVADADVGCNLTARKGVIEAETALQQVAAPDESVKAFVAQFDKAVKGATATGLEAVVVRADLPKFVKRIASSKPETSTTQIVRVESLDDQHVAVEVKLDIVVPDLLKGTKSELRGTAVLTLRRVGSSWMLEKIDIPTNDQ